MSTIREVAAHAGVGIATVSRVLNDVPTVKPETRQKVLDAVVALDYVPNELARGVFRKRSGIVAMLIPNIRHVFFGNLAQYVEEALYQHGYKLMLCSTGGNRAVEEEYMQLFRTNLVDGVILGTANLAASTYASLNKPAVATDRLISDQIPVVVSNNTQGGELAAQVLVERGFKEVAQLVDSGVVPCLSHERHVSFERVIRQAGITLHNLSLDWNHFEFDTYQTFASETLANYPAIDAIMAPDMIAGAFLKAALAAGKQVPEQFGVVAYDGTYLAKSSALEMTAVVQPIQAMGERIVSILMQLIEHKPVEAYFMELPVVLEVGKST